MQTWILVEKLEGKRPFTIPRRRWECDIKIDLKVIGWKGVYWIDVAQYTDKLRSLENAIIKLRVT